MKRFYRGIQYTAHAAEPTHSTPQAEPSGGVLLSYRGVPYAIEHPLPSTHAPDPKIPQAIVPLRYRGVAYFLAKMSD